jgi:pimeloyl-ACP methyl ester carboxylesterase
MEDLVKRMLEAFSAALVAVTLGASLLRAADPVTLKTTEFGHGPTIVFVHTLASGRMVWLPTAKKLLTTHHVVMVDLPGHGDSPLPDPFSIDACVAALDQVMAKQNADSTVLVGAGLGGLIALEDAEAHPERIRGLVLIDASTHMGMKIDEQRQQAFFQMMDTQYDTVLGMMFRGQGRDSLEQRDLLATAQAVPPNTVKSYIRALMNVDAAPGLKGLKPPLVVVGSERWWPADKDWPTLAKEKGYENADSIQTHRVANSSALIMKQQPDSLAAIIDSFAARAMTRAIAKK